MNRALLVDDRLYTRAGQMRSFDPVATRRTFEEAVEQIAEKVKSGDLHVGDRLPSERELHNPLIRPSDTSRNIR